MSKILATVQSNYIPWKGYFDLIHRADEFVLYDHVQYTKNDWRNRNQIKTSRGLQWLTIPVQQKGRFGQCIDETEVADPSWAESHWRTIRQNYLKAPYFATYGARLEQCYTTLEETLLSRINHRFLSLVCGMLGISTRLSSSRDYHIGSGRTESLVDLCIEAGATEYLSGPSARSYLDESLFASHGIKVTWMDYSGYPEYPQFHPPFQHAVSIIDLILHLGPEATRYMSSFPRPGGSPEAAGQAPGGRTSGHDL